MVCAMWQGRCGRPARLVVNAIVRIATYDEPLAWLVCDDMRCICASQNHVAEFRLVNADTRLLTSADESGRRLEVSQA